MPERVIYRGDLPTSRKEKMEAEIVLHPLSGFSLIVGRTKVLVVPEPESRVQSYQPEEGVGGL